VRDIEGDYRSAMVAEYESLRRAGRTQAAAHVARALREQYGHEVEPRPAKEPEPVVPPEPVKERADMPAPPENTAEPQPKRRGPAKKTAAPPPAKG